MKNTLSTLLFFVPLFYNFYSQEKEKDSLSFQLISLQEINVTSTRAVKEQPFSFSNSVFPMSAGELAIVIPADFMLSILSSAPPLPPDIMAPA